MKNRTPIPISCCPPACPAWTPSCAGGFTPDRLYLVEGQPGSGKTTLGLQFLIEGVKQGERVLYISLAENAVELHAVATSHGWSMDGIHIHEVIPSESMLDPKEPYTMFHPSEVELGSATQDILAWRPRRHA